MNIALLKIIWTPIWVLASYLLFNLIPWLILYQQGKYVRKNYPTRYVNQLTSSKSNQPFPFNVLGFKFASPIKNLPKIADIAKQENDEKLEKSARYLKIFFYFYAYLYLIFLLYKIITY